MTELQPYEPVPQESYIVPVYKKDDYDLINEYQIPAKSMSRALNYAEFYAKLGFQVLDIRVA